MRGFRVHRPLVTCAAAAVAVMLLDGSGLAARDAAPAQFGGALQQFVDRAHAFSEAARLGLDYLPGEVVVRFRPEASVDGQRRVLSTMASRPGALRVEPQGDYVVLRDSAQPNAHALAARLAAQPEVEFASPNYIAKVSPFERLELQRTSQVAARPRGWARLTPNDEHFGLLQWNMSLLRMPNAWNIQPGATEEIVVAVIDTGITTVDESFTFPIWTGFRFEDVSMPFAVNPDLPASRLVAQHNYAFPPTGDIVVDMDGHGTHVSSTIGEATHNGSLLAGMAYNVRIMPLKVCTSYWEVMIGRGLAGTPGFVDTDAGGCPSSNTAAAIRYAVDNGADVINISLGGGNPFEPQREALLYAVSRGAFVAIAMGNDFEDGNEVSYPARFAQDIEGVMSVASVGRLEQRAFYSSTGPHAEIAAPGGDSRVGGLNHFGVIWQSSLSSAASPLRIVPRFDIYAAIGTQGTSMAAPHVAGLAALIMAQSPGVSPANVERIIRSTAKDLGTPGKDDEFGNGLIQPRAALFGRGLLR